MISKLCLLLSDEDRVGSFSCLYFKCKKSNSFQKNFFSNLYYDKNVCKKETKKEFVITAVLESFFLSFLTISIKANNVELYDVFLEVV